MRHHGTAGVLAIILIGLVGAALVAMSSHFAYDARRTSQLAAESQLRQLLIASPQLLPNNPQANQDLPTPTGKLTILSVTKTDTTTQLEMRATLNGRSLTQILHLQNNNGHWTVTSADLAP